MAVTREEILEFLAQSPEEGVELQDISKGLGKTTDEISPSLSAMRPVGFVDNPERGTWRITEKGLKNIGAVKKITKAPEETGGVMKGKDLGTAEETGVPGAYEKFQQIGRSLGLKEEFLKVLCDHVFLGNVYDLNYVWDTLNGMYLRPDVTRRWFNIWSRVVNQPIPAEIAAQVLPITTKEGREAEAKVTKMFTIIGGEIVADPEGEFTFAQARQVLMTKAIQQAAPNLGGDSLSGIITAITPFIESRESAKVAEIEKQGETSVLAVAIKALAEQKGGGQQALTINDILDILSRIDEARKSALASVAAVASGDSKRPSMLDELERMANVYNTMKGLFAPAGNSGSSPILISLKGEGGETGAIPLDTFFKVSDHNRKIKQEDEELEGKREMGKTVRGFMDNISRAAARFATR